jgi:hypothetical protein
MKMISPRFSIPFALAALAALPACAPLDTATPAPATPVAGTIIAPATLVVAAPAPAVVARSAALRAGSGSIDSIAFVPGGSPSTPTRRLSVRMDDGTTQIVDMDATGLALGDRVEFTGDGYFKRASTGVPSANVAAGSTTPPVTTGTLRPGFGRIETDMAAPAAGMRRLGIRMDDGSLQLVDSGASGFAIGERVELTRDAFIRPAR